ncbi:hypothetical protein HN587_00750 [Candidatus Woesearchaeota archaeon]|nr:hypothetical protein [Candidatus Woesearchaeota archaeon]
MGFFGGVVRALVGILKSDVLKGKEKINWTRLIFLLLASGIIGAFAGLLITTQYAFLLLAGYAGADLIEGMYKTYHNHKLKK